MLNSLLVNNQDEKLIFFIANLEVFSMQQNSITNWFELARYLINTKRGLRLIGFLIVVIAILLFLIIQVMRPDIEITTNAGTIAIKTGSTQNAILMLSAAGGDSSPWVGTGIKVKKDNKVKIEASGRVHTAMAKLIIIAQTDRTIEPSWVGPEGSMPDQEKEWDSQRDQYKLMPNAEGAHYGYGMLVAAVQNSNGQILKNSYEPVRNKFEFTAKTDGELVLAVNDLLLRGDAQNIYALPFETKNFEYYKFKAQEEATLKEENVNSWSEKTLQDKTKEQYQKRVNAWKEIVKNNNWMVWYNDNIGAFSVSVTVN